MGKVAPASVIHAFAFKKHPRPSNLCLLLPKRNLKSVAAFSRVQKIATGAHGGHFSSFGRLAESLAGPACARF